MAPRSSPLWHPPMSATPSPAPISAIARRRVVEAAVGAAGTVFSNDARGRMMSFRAVEQRRQGQDDDEDQHGRCWPFRERTFRFAARCSGTPRSASPARSATIPPARDKRTAMCDDVKTPQPGRIWARARRLDRAAAHGRNRRRASARTLRQPPSTTAARRARPRRARLRDRARTSARFRYGRQPQRGAKARSPLCRTGCGSRTPPGRP